MMDLLEKIGSQVPALTVLVILTSMFLKAQKGDREGFLTALREVREGNALERKEVFDRLNLMHTDHLTARQDSRAVIDRVAIAMHDISMAVATCPLKKA